METTVETEITDMINFHKALFKSILFVGVVCIIVLAKFDFFLAGGIVAVATLAAEIGNIVIRKRRIEQVPIRAFSNIVNEFKNRPETNEP